jgi:hypothetical protein
MPLLGCFAKPKCGIRVGLLGIANLAEVELLVGVDIIGESRRFQWPNR